MTAGCCDFFVLQLFTVSGGIDLFRTAIRRQPFCLSENFGQHMKTKQTIIFLALMTVLIPSGRVNAANVIVPGTSDLWLAGMPPNSTASGGDVAPGQSPVLVTGVQIMPGGSYFFTASGSVRHGPSQGFSGPEGDSGQITPHFAGAENGIAGLTAPVDALIGVFLSSQQPDLSAAPAGLDFTSSASRTYSQLSPALQQPFFIGDGLNGQVPREIIAPQGASRLFLGTMDGQGWFNNEGEFNVTVVPEPNVVLLLSLGSIACLFAIRRGRN